MKSALLAIGLAMAAAGCYRNIPAQFGSVSAGNSVVVSLTPQGSARLAPAVGSYAIQLQGNVTSAADGELTLALQSVTRRGELNPTQFQGAAVSLNQGDVDEIFTHEISRRRSTTAFIALGAVGVGLVIVLAKAVGILETSGTGNPTPPVP